MRCRCGFCEADEWAEGRARFLEKPTRSESYKGGAGVAARDIHPSGGRIDGSLDSGDDAPDLGVAEEGGNWVPRDVGDGKRRAEVPHQRIAAGGVFEEVRQAVEVRIGGVRIRGEEPQDIRHVIGAAGGAPNRLERKAEIDDPASARAAVVLDGGRSGSDAIVN